MYSPYIRIKYTGMMLQVLTIFGSERASSAEKTAKPFTAPMSSSDVIENNPLEDGLSKRDAKEQWTSFDYFSKNIT